MSFQETITEILKDLKDSVGGVDAIFMVDLSDASVQASYPESESKSLEFIGSATGNSIASFEVVIKRMGQIFTVQEMVFESEDKRVFNLRISTSKEANYALCIIGPVDGLRVGFVRTMFESTYKQKILTAMQEFGMI
jgi:predicted regulator of Ras-like GTPase activity (Roadblock/LC7/MglB family)